jgi:hypothetical protein
MEMIVLSGKVEGYLQVNVYSCPLQTRQQREVIGFHTEQEHIYY